MSKFKHSEQVEACSQATGELHQALTHINEEMPTVLPVGILFITSEGKVLVITGPNGKLETVEYCCKAIVDKKGPDDIINIFRNN